MEQGLLAKDFERSGMVARSDYTVSNPWGILGIIAINLKYNSQGAFEDAPVEAHVLSMLGLFFL
jgi:hypothetical protein